jgi:hypothetical protein
MPHAWVSWRYLELNGRIRSKGIAQPRRERILVRAALAEIGLRYKEIVPVINKHYHGHKGDQPAVISWLDFCIWTGKRMIVVLFRLNSWKQREKDSHASKKQLLDEKGIPWLELDRRQTSQIYASQIRRFISKQQGGTKW